MDLEYDEKFEEMKKYIPFLEGMINKLESTSSGSVNPRQAQLDKIRSLRDLLLDKKKRMKMENLLKCEQVLVNLYAKVEQRDTLPGIKPAEPMFPATRTSTSSKDHANLDAVRNKLKSVAKRREENPGTLPEIARANESQDNSTAGSKEPALFQRRPNQSTKKNYTRVLVSPDRSSNRWSGSEHSSQTLFSRRSPRRSPKRYSPTYHKKERKKSKQGHSPKSKDLNITLKVPQESLNSLNTKDILSRIINCSNNDVDIDTLRELRSQILGELKHTGAKDDISDLILQSSKKKRKQKLKKEVEEGELSDSESEAIESIYGSLVILDKDQNVTGQAKTSTKEEEKPRKIQIRLVINTDKEVASESDTSQVKKDPSNIIDDSELQMFEGPEKKETDAINMVKVRAHDNDAKQNTASDISKSIASDNSNTGDVTIMEGQSKLNSTEVTKSESESSKTEINEKVSKPHFHDEFDLSDANQSQPEENPSNKDVAYKPNFYKPIIEQEINVKVNACSKTSEANVKTVSVELSDNNKDPVDPNTNSFQEELPPESKKTVKMDEVIIKAKDNVEIPLLHEPTIVTQKPQESVVSEIDILQALKKEILSESIDIPGTDVLTPALHQPKLTKVASAQEIAPKKRISIEKYKQKATAGSKPTPLFLKDISKNKEEYIRKQSLKLTEKEFERFKIAIDNISSDDDTCIGDGEYDDLAPLSPDNEEFTNTGGAQPPVIIPADPVKNNVVNSKADIDMRTLISSVSTHKSSTTTIANMPSPLPSASPLKKGSTITALSKDAKLHPNLVEINRPVDPRLKREVNSLSSFNESANLPAINSEVTPQPVPPIHFVNITPVALGTANGASVTNINTNLLSSMSPNINSVLATSITPSITPNMTPIMTPSMTPIMTPSRTPIMTPNARTFDIEDQTNRKHVYATIFEPRDYRDHSVSRDEYTQREKPEHYSNRRKSRWEGHEDRDRSNSAQRDSHQTYNRFNESYNYYNYKNRNDRSEMPVTPSHPFGRSDCPSTPSHTFGRSDCPPTPNHPFGISGLMTPSYSMGRTECPPTPSRSYGRSDCPPTPNHPFGRLDCPTTPSHPFGRSDCPPTPNHHFGRSEMPISHSTTRIDRDPRYHRTNDIGVRSDDKERSYYHSAHKKDNYRNYSESSDAYNIRNRHYKEPGPHYTKSYDSHFDEGPIRNSRDHKIDHNDKRYNREQSVGRHEERLERSNSRARSVSRTSERDTAKTLSVTPHTGRSFTIDTSVNSTFQDFLKRDKHKSVFEHIFDSRKQRASSVGRSLVLDTNDLSLSSQPLSLRNERSNVNFRRARSVVRDVENRSFNEVKADFKTFTLKTKDCTSNKHMSQSKQITECKESPRRKKGDVPFQDRKTVRSSSKQPYSPRKNSRDPRLHRDSYTKSRYRDDYNYDSRDKKKHGIVYSNDNIAKGTILRSDYGVRNYKIPKIKRPVEDLETKDDQSQLKECESKKKEKSSDVAIGKSKSKDSTSQDRLKLSKSVESTKQKCEIQVTDMSKKINTLKKIENKEPKLPDDGKSVPKTRKSKRIIHDSESDSEINTENVNEPKTSITDNKNELPNHLDDVLSSDFGVDDLEIFSDNIASDPVIDNINALIADLDDHLNTSKNDGTDTFSKEISLENMLENISSLTHEEVPKPIADTCLRDINEFIEEDLNKNDQPLSELRLLNDIANKNPDLSNFPDVTNSSTSLQNELPTSEVDKMLSISNLVESEKFSSVPILAQDNAEDIVSTTETTVSESNEIYNKIEDQNTEHTEHCSTPDSTYTRNTSLSVQDHGLPDSSTSRLPNESTDVTSSVDSAVSKEHIEPSSSFKDVSPAVDSIGSILSILQNKAKIKELLSMLGEQSTDNDKIKKKLEKLSEIVSDEEEIKEDVDHEVSEENIGISSVDDNAIIDEKHNDEDNISTGKIGNNYDNVTTETKGNDDETILADNIENKEANIGDDSEPEMDTLSSLKKIADKQQSKPKSSLKKSKVYKRKRSKFAKKNQPKDIKRVTRSGVINMPKTQGQAKSMSRELLKLQEDINEMFIKDDILNATGIRMCRLAKLVDDKGSGQKDSTDTKPVVVLEKCNKELNLNKESNKELDVGLDANENKPDEIKKKKAPRKKLGLKSKSKILVNQNSDEPEEKQHVQHVKYKPGPKSKTKSLVNKDEVDPYAFETDSLNDSIASKRSEDSLQTDSDSDRDSLTSSQSFGSSEVLAEIKKKSKRKRGSWQTGVIKPKHKKKKIDQKQIDQSTTKQNEPIQLQDNLIPDLNCFTDKSYCFLKNVVSYPCRLCVYTGDDIVAHYKKQHPHSEIPLSRLCPEVAKEAIEQCDQINFQAITKYPTDKLVCRFCYNEFGKKKASLESFFWHVVSTHTGEYKQLCSECINITRCPLNLDIPPPPKDAKGQLIGYICGKCNFTQISLENLKTHVIVRHNDEQTEVYTINLAVMSRKLVNLLAYRSHIQEEDIIKPRVLRSSRSNQSMTETSDERSDITETNDVPPQLKSPKRKTKRERDKVVSGSKTNMQSKITFENDDSASETATSVKIEREDQEYENNETSFNLDKEARVSEYDITNEDPVAPEQPSTDQPADIPVSDDICAVPHFKIKYAESGSKEFVCCINGLHHYKTTLLISMKKHVQNKHNNDNWDGYCYVCKVIVTPQGRHLFVDCLQHFLDKHMDEFPIMENVDEPVTEPVVEEPRPASRPYINVRPLSQLKDPISQEENSLGLPKIESVVSLGVTPETVVTYGSHVTPNEPLPPPALPELPCELPTTEEGSKYEEAQAEVMSQKHPVVLEAMLIKEKLVKMYKCAGSYCSFVSDSAEVALAHALAHQQIGGENALKCAYCDFDCSGNAIDLVLHVFKHGDSPCVCGYCFYRASCPQLVVAHSNRIHPEKKPQVLVSSNASSDKDTATMLSRDLVVPYYICNQAGSDGTFCKFRTYTSRQFSEHMLQRHKDLMFSCYMCHAMIIKTELIQHMKSHGLNLYQCTWCFYGADNESDLLAHASSKHPSKQPQAYLRIITSKDGSSEFRVLPLASFNKSTTLAEIINPNNVTENPKKEAERSIELERLIGQTKQLFESITTTAESENAINNDTTITQVPELAPVEIRTQAHKTPPRVATPQQKEDTIPQDNRSFLRTMLKTETCLSSTKDTSDNIVCLDSDDESATPIINVPDEVVSVSSNVPAVSNAVSSIPSEAVTVSSGASSILSAPPELRISREDLFKCPSCLSTFRTSGGLKRHITCCISKPHQPLPCPHCQKITNNRQDLLEHYSNDHMLQTRFPSPPKPQFACSVCGYRTISLNTTKKHIKSSHKMIGTNVSLEVEHGKLVHIVQAENEPERELRQPPKRKSSTSAAEPPQKQKRYGPQDVDLLPINPILEELVYCTLCEFNTKVRLNMVRHLQLHAEQQPVPQTAPVNPVPHLETNERHFDKMVNLASSSIVNRTPDKPTRPEAPAVVSLHIAPEAASRYPKYVPERQRHTCGAKDCSYISVDEAMLRCHWDTLHSGSNDFHCVHCPPYQHLDKSKPLTAARIIAHLKMHDTTLYACSSCSYYHYKRQVVEKHLSEVHKGSKLMVVREEATPSSSQAAVPPAVAPTMDLKPWQCGLCKFKSMLRPEVVEHCANMHQSKMQYKCGHCPFRTSTSENVFKHQHNSHPDKEKYLFYYYYREGSIPEEPDGVPRWQKQRLKFGISDPEVKTETPDDTLSKPSTPVNIDLNIVKKEVDRAPSLSSVLNIEELCKKFGEFCEPNGLRYKCCLCSVVTEDSREAMQSHLYEELQYRKWLCGVCSYKAFHKTGLHEHIASEHRGQGHDPISLPSDNNIEKWVTELLDHQARSIEKNKDNLLIQKIQVPAPTGPPKKIEGKQVQTPPSRQKPSMKELEQAFGQLGVANNMQFCCPKCVFRAKDEGSMRDHLESELTKIRWCCSNCSQCFQTYHEVQFHCKSVHDGQGARPVEAIRDPFIRNAWVAAVIQVQKLSMRCLPLERVPDVEKPPPSAVDNSLLVVRYEEKVPNPEEITTHRASPIEPTDSDDEKLIIDEPSHSKSLLAFHKCPHCPYQTKYLQALSIHTYRHYGLYPFGCAYCDYTSHKRLSVGDHINKNHPNRPRHVKNIPLPTGPPLNKDLKFGQKVRNKRVCLTCLKILNQSETLTHNHDDEPVNFGKNGDVIYKCTTCVTLRKDISTIELHYAKSHPNIPVNYSQVTVRMLLYGTNFKLHFEDIQESSAVVDLDDSSSHSDVSNPPPRKRVARKSTAKLPMQMVAKKSTAKLPMFIEPVEYSYYGTKASPIQEFHEVTTLMSFCNTVMPFTVKKLSEIINIEPKVIVKDVKK